MKKMVNRYCLDNIREVISLNSEGIRRTKEHDIVTQQLVKSFAVTADKRNLYADYGMFPYGYDLNSPCVKL